MAKIQLDIPEDLMKDLGGEPETVGREILLASAFDWCRRGELATSQAARLAGVTYAGFLEAAVQRQAALLDYDSADLQAELSRPLPEGIDRDAVPQGEAHAQAARG